MEECKPSANPQGIVLVAVLVIVIETSQVEHEDENDDEDDPQSRSAESIPCPGYRRLRNCLAISGMRGYCCADTTR